MSQKRDYPLFLIDRAKANKYPFDYVVCMDKEVGFIAKVVQFHSDESLNEFKRNVEKLPYHEVGTMIINLKQGGLVMVVEDFMRDFELSKQRIERIKVLMKKGFKKLLHAELSEMNVKEELSIENQIKLQKETLRQSQQNYDNLCQRDGKENVDYCLKLQEATINTLEEQKDVQNIFNDARK